MKEKEFNAKEKEAKQLIESIKLQAEKNSKGIHKALMFEKSQQKRAEKQEAKNNKRAFKRQESLQKSAKECNKNVQNGGNVAFGFGQSLECVRKVKMRNVLLVLACILFCVSLFVVFMFSFGVFGENNLNSNAENGENNQEINISNSVSNPEAIEPTKRTICGCYELNGDARWFDTNNKVVETQRTLCAGVAFVIENENHLAWLFRDDRLKSELSRCYVLGKNFNVANWKDTGIGLCKSGNNFTISGYTTTYDCFLGAINNNSANISPKDIKYHNDCVSFEGHFDGNGYEIQTSVEQAPIVNSAYVGQKGLFSCITNATVQNLKIKAFVKSNEVMQVLTGIDVTYSGSLAGFSQTSLISNVDVELDLSNGKIFTAGGLVYADRGSLIENCDIVSKPKFSGSLQVYGAYNGTFGTLHNSFGGIVNRMYGIPIATASNEFSGVLGTIRNCTFSLTERDNAEYYLGINFGGIFSNGYGNIENCSVNFTNYAQAEVKAKVVAVGHNIGGLVGCFSGGNITNSKATLSLFLQRISASTAGVSYVGGLVGKNMFSLNNAYFYNTEVMASKVVNGASDEQRAIKCQEFSKTTISNCSVTGEEISSGGVAINYVGGIVGLADASSIRIENCSSNFKNISGGQFTCGIVGRIISYRKGTSNSFPATNAEIINCKNYSNISTYSPYYNGGIVGDITYHDNVTIEGCVNFGNVSGGVDTGGIVGRLYDNLHSQGKDVLGAKISNCVNWGNVDVLSSSNECGGIVGAWFVKDSIEIENCANKMSGAITVRNFGGGIVGRIDLLASSDQLVVDRGRAVKIRNCDNFADIDSVSHSGGIVGYINANDTSGGIRQYDFQTTIENCNNYGSSVSASSSGTGYVGGILGLFDVRTSSPANNHCNNFVELKNCNNYASVSANNVTDATISVSCGGIAGSILMSGAPVSGSTKTSSVVISNCNNFGMSVSSRGCEVGGMIGEIYFGDGMTNRSLNIQNSSSFAAVSGGQFAGGFLGNVQNISCTTPGIIKNCNAYGKVTVYGEAGSGGFVGNLSEKTGKITFENCNAYGNVFSKARAGGFSGGVQASVIDIKFVGCNAYGKVEQTAGGGNLHLAGFVSAVWGSQKVTFENCNAYGDVAGTTESSGFVGIIGYGAKNITFKNSNSYGNFKNTINGNSHNGGFVGAIVQASDVSFDGCNVYGNVSNVGTMAGGFVGFISNFENTATLTTFNNCNVYGDFSNNNTYGGGFCGYAGDSNSIKYLTFKNCNVFGDVKAGDYSGGFFGTMRSTKAQYVKFDSCNVYGDISVKSESGGFFGDSLSVGHAKENFDAGTGLRIEFVNCSVNSENFYCIAWTGGFATASASANMKFDDCSVNIKNFSDSSNCNSGFFSFDSLDDSKVTFYNCTVNIDAMKNLNTNTYTAGFALSNGIGYADWRNCEVNINKWYVPAGTTNANADFIYATGGIAGATIWDGNYSTKASGNILVKTEATITGNTRVVAKNFTSFTIAGGKPTLSAKMTSGTLEFTNTFSDTLKVKQVSILRLTAGGTNNENPSNALKTLLVGNFKNYIQMKVGTTTYDIGKTVDTNLQIAQNGKFSFALSTNNTKYANGILAYVTVVTVGAVPVTYNIVVPVTLA